MQSVELQVLNETAVVEENAVAVQVHVEYVASSPYPFKSLAFPSITIVSPMERRNAGFPSKLSVAADALKK